MFNTIPNNPFPPSSASAGAGGGGSYVLPTASADTLGGVKVGSNLEIADGVLSAPTPYVLPTASAETLGGVKVGSNLSIADGVLSAPAPYVLPTASADTLGGVKVGTGLSIADGVLSATGGVNYSTTEQKIGTWIDGKDLFMKTYVLKLDGVDQYTFTTNNYDIGDHYERGILLHAQGYRTSGNYIDVMSNTNEFLIVISTDGLVYCPQASRFTDIFITTCYTKPTESED